MPATDGKKNPSYNTQGQDMKRCQTQQNKNDRRGHYSIITKMEMGRTCGKDGPPEMDTQSHHVESKDRLEERGKTKNKMGGPLQIHSRRTVVKSGKKQREIETFRSTRDDTQQLEYPWTIPSETEYSLGLGHLRSQMIELIPVQAGGPSPQGIQSG